MEQHFVEFYSPGTFVAEISIRSIDAWDISQAVGWAREIVERYDARPYGFRFITRERADDELDSHISAKSGMYYLGGRVETREEVETRNDPNERILQDNMRANNIKRIVVNDNSWRWTQVLNDGDVVLDLQQMEEEKRGERLAYILVRDLSTMQAIMEILDLIDTEHLDLVY